MPKPTDTFIDEVTVSVSLKARTNESARRVLATELLLEREGEERTAFRFSLDREGRLLRESVHDLPKPLRSG